MTGPRMVPTPSARLGQGEHAKPPSTAAQVASAVGFALMTCVTAFGLLVYLEIIAEVAPDGAGVTAIVFGSIALLALLAGWWASLRAMLRRLRPRGVTWRPDRPKPVRRGKGRIGTLIRVTFDAPPPGRSFRTPTATSTPLTIADVRAAQRLSSIERHRPPQRGPVEPIKRLPGIERSIGEALYQLDRAPDRGGLTRAQVTEIRLIGLRASAWLSGHAHRVDPAGHELLSDQQIAGGIEDYAALASAVADLAAGRSDPSAVRAATDRLDALIDPTA